ncbi:hypothetical protein ASA1KI_09480 [Opitutales bacterium ASA1]|uniref:glycosyltransferase family 2 protein n=1 Tax=Congregicoccus parvus TaxID=3081749 RepID=UPI002B311245|nr:hypothetical protein ASA1KI_09480 [Opitutales bacterium ASA1]
MSDLHALRQVSVAVLACNRREDLRLTLRTLVASGAPWHEIIVADNASSDGTATMLRDEFPTVRVLASPTNDGVAALNRAYRAASGSWILSLDDDSCPDLDSWGALARALAADPPFAAVTCSVRARPSRSQSSPIAPASSPLAPYLGFHQAGGLLRRDTVERLGGFDEELFLWGVELHLAARAALAGLAFARCDSAVVVHRNTPVNRSSRRHAFHYCRNLLLLLLRYAPESSQRLLVDRFLARVLLFSLLHHTSAYVRAVRDASAIHRRTRIRKPLTDHQFAAMNPDLRSSFSFLG